MPELWRGEELADRMALLAERARDRGAPVVVTQQTGPAATSFAPINPGWQLSPRLRLHDDHLRLRKRATDRFFRANLAELLAERDVDTVVITGAATDYCVDATARSALSHGFDVIVVGDSRHNQVLSQPIHPGGTLRVVAAEDRLTGTASPAAASRRISARPLGSERPRPVQQGCRQGRQPGSGR